MRNHKVFTGILFLELLTISFPNSLAVAQIASDPASVKTAETIEAEKRVIQRIVDFFNAVGDSKQAAKVQKWYEKKWLSFGEVTGGDNAETSSTGYITVNKKFAEEHFLGAKGKLDRKSFSHAADISQSLVHEFHHASQIGLLGIQPSKIGSSWAQTLNWGNKYETQAYHTALGETANWINTLQKQYPSKQTEELANRIVDVCRCWQSYNNDIKSHTIGVGPDPKNCFIQNTMQWEKPGGRALKASDVEKIIEHIRQKAQEEVAAHKLLHKFGDSETPMRNRLARLPVTNEQDLKKLLEKESREIAQQLVGTGKPAAYLDQKAKEIYSKGATRVVELWKKRQEKLAARFASDISTLRNTTVKLNYSPNPAQIGPDGKVQVQVHPQDASIQKQLKELRSIAAEITRQQLKVTETIHWSNGSEENTADFEFTAPGKYPVEMQRTIILETASPIGGSKHFKINFSTFKFR